MVPYIVRRLLLAIPVMFGISVLVFVAIRQLPGDPALAVLGPNPTPESIAIVRADLRLDDPLPVQYGTWLGKAVRGDFGDSPFYHGPVSEEITSRLPVTLQLVIMAMLASLAVGIPSGVISAVNQSSLADFTVRVINIVALSIPSFWLATLLLLVPSIWWGYAPPIGYIPLWEDPQTNLEQFYMPVLALTAATSAAIMRMTRSAVLEVMRADYVRTARSKGLQESRVIWAHALRNAMIPVLSIVGLQVAILLGGQVVVEEIFQLPGIGRLLISALANSDYLVVQAIVLYLAVAVVLINLLVDVLYAVIDPRIRYA